MNNPAQGMTQQQLINSANQQIGMNNPAQGMTWQQITQHANNMYNQQYTPERTAFLLKYTKEK